jgi:hypothetical protein
MPLLKLFETIESLFGFTGDEGQYHHSKRQLSQTTEICINCVNKTVSHSSVPLLNAPLVSLFKLLRNSLSVDTEKQTKI